MPSSSNMTVSPLDLYMVTFNCGRELVDPHVFSASILRPYRDRDHLPDLIVLCLEELAPLAYSFLGGSFLVPYFARILAGVQDAARALEPADASHATPQPLYQPLITRNCGLTGLVILAKRTSVDDFSLAETAEIGVGRSETGNKGAVGARVTYTAPGAASNDPVSLTFVAAHLYPFEDGFERRNEDWKRIVQGLVFVPVTPKAADATRASNGEQQTEETEPLLPNDDSQHPGSGGGNAQTRLRGMFEPDSLLFFGGDLNYRTSDSSPSPEDIQKHYPQPVEDSADPKHYTHLLPRDQLSRERRAGKTLHGLAEAEIAFPPTYKYSAKQQRIAAQLAETSTAESRVWNWSAHRWPSWCDRILFSSSLAGAVAGPDSPLKVLAYEALPCQPTSDHRPVALVCQLDPSAVSRSKLSAQASTRTSRPPFSLNPRWAEDRSAARAKEVVTGVFAYLAWTWEGYGLLLAAAVGACGGWWIMRSLILA